MRGLKHFAAVSFIAIAGLASSAWAGTLTVDKYQGITGGGGALVTAHYSDIDADCCEGDIEYLQLIQLTDPTTGKPKSIPAAPPNDVGWKSTFIDPQYKQGTDTFDQEPWYDFTSPAAGGPGPNFEDMPNGWNGDAPLSFSATTLVVCADSTTDTITVLGGFNWGFTVLNKNPPPGQTTTLHPLTAVDPTDLGDDLQGQDMVTTLNDALDDFYDGLPNTNPQQGNNPWTLQELPSDEECCALTTYVPAPSALYGIPICLIGLAACRRWSKAA